MKKTLCFLLSILLGGFAANALAESEKAPLKVILCCDEGYMNDDALALSMLIKLEQRNEVEILGIALTGGNNFIETQYTSAYGTLNGSYQYLTEYLKQLGREDIPVFKGTDYPLGFTAENISELDGIHRTFLSENGTTENRVIVNDRFGALWHFHDCHGTLTDDDAARDFIIEQVNAYPQEVAIVAIGPTTDIARAIQKDPSIAQKAKGIYIMGGAFGDLEAAQSVDGQDILAVPGANTTNYAEYNVLYDPEAFSVLLRAGFDTLVITPAVCNEPVPEGLGNTLIQAANGHADAVMQSWIDYHTTTIQDYPYWDPMTVYAMMRPDQITEQKIGYVMEITDIHSEQYGESVFFSEEEYQNLTQEEKSLCGKATVVFSMNGFWDYLLPLLAE